MMLWLFPGIRFGKFKVLEWGSKTYSRADKDALIHTEVWWFGWRKAWLYTSSYEWYCKVDGTVVRLAPHVVNMVEARLRHMAAEVNLLELVKNKEELRDVSKG